MHATPTRWRGSTPDRVAVRMPGRRDAPAFAVTEGATRRRCRSARSIRSRRRLPKRRSRIAWPDRRDIPLGDRRRAAAAAVDQESRAPRQRRELRHHRRRPACAAARQRERHDRLASSLRRSVDPARHRLRRLARRHRRGASRRRPAATAAWHPHGFGRDIAALAADALGPHVPRAAWERAPSELPESPGAGAVDARARAAWPVLRADPERDGASAPPRRPLPLGARRAVRRRPQRAGHRRASRVCEPLRLCRALPAAALSRSRSRRGRGGSRRAGRSHRSATHAEALDAGGTPSALLAAALEASGADPALPFVRVEQAGRPMAADGSGGRLGLAAGPRNRRENGRDEDRSGSTGRGRRGRTSSRASSPTSKACSRRSRIASRTRTC